jgi:phosphoribosylformylglycinamidine synthase
MSSKIKVGVVVFPGSNCDQDMVDAMNQYENVMVQKLWHKSQDLQGSQLVILPGGFSYGDYLRSGAIARFSPIMNEVISFAGNGGFGLNEMLGTAAAIIIAAFVIIPGLRTFAGVVISKLNTWWTSISTSIFPAS